MDIRFVRLDEDICARLNEMARSAQRTVSDLVNDIVRAHLRQSAKTDAERRATS